MQFPSWGPRATITAVLADGRRVPMHSGQVALEVLRRRRARLRRVTVRMAPAGPGQSAAVAARLLRG